MGREKTEKSFKGLEREYEVRYSTIQKVFKHFTNKTVIQSEQDFQIAEKCANALVSEKKSRKAIESIESSESMMGIFNDLLSQAPTAISKEDLVVADEEDEEQIVTNSKLNEFINVVKNQINILLLTNQRYEELISNPKVIKAINLKQDAVIKRGIYRAIFRLHKDAGVSVREETVYKNVQELYSTYGPGPILVRIDEVYSFLELSNAGLSKNKIYGTGQGLFSLIRGKDKDDNGSTISAIEKIWRSGKYFSKEEIFELYEINQDSLDSVDMPKYVQTKSEPPSDVSYIQKTLAPHTDRVYVKCNQSLYCDLISNSSQLYRTDIVIDHEGLAKKIDEIKRSPQASNLITCEEDTPFFFEEFIMES